MHSHNLTSFNTWIGWALGDLAYLPDRDAPQTRQHVIRMATTSVRHALAKANEMGCRERKAMCLRVLSWLNSDARRVS